MPNARRTTYDNYNVHTRVDSRSTKSTYIVTDRPQEHTAQTVTPEEGRKWAKLQDAYIQDRKSTRLNSSHVSISYAVFCLKKKKINFEDDVYKFNTFSILLCL